MPVIYALKDPATGEVRYIGKANNLVDRLRCHKFERDNPKFQTRKARWLRTLETEPVAEVCSK